jgi:hypothetical protein
MSLPTPRDRQKELHARAEALTTSKIVAPTTKALVEDLVCLLAEVMDDYELEYGLRFVGEREFGQQDTPYRRERALEVIHEFPDHYKLIARRKAGEWEEVND